MKNTAVSVAGAGSFGLRPQDDNKVKMRKVKTLVLFSGGLDSMLAAKMLMEQGIEVTALSFTSNFFSAAKAKKAAKQLGLKLKIADIGREMLELVKNPPSGRGKNMNPCLDCHALMMRKAGEYLKCGLYKTGVESGIANKIYSDGGITGKTHSEGDIPECRLQVGEYDFLATGEVLGQRPFSQNKQALARVMKLAGVEALRPLSAKLLPETEMERNGLVGRKKLLDISGRARERQIELAKKYGIKEYPSPAGGCLLTDPAFSRRLKAMLENWPDCTKDDVELIKHGRVFWLELKGRQSALAGDYPETGNLKNNSRKEKILVVVGRNEEENQNLTNIAKPGDFMVELKSMTGPLAIMRIRLEMRNNMERDKLNSEYGIRNAEFTDIFQIKIPMDLNLNSLLLKNFNEIIKSAAILTGYYSTKARGKSVESKIKIKS